MKHKLKIRLPALVLVLVTTLFWNNYDRYEATGPVLLASPSLTESSRSRGQVSERDGRFTLSVTEPGKWAEVRFKLPETATHSSIRVRGRIRVEGVVEGRYRWRCARLLLVQYDQGNKWIPGHHGVVAERGTQEWEYHEDVFEIHPDAAIAEVALQQAGTAGTAWFDRIEAQPVRVRTSFLWWRVLFAVMWVAAAIGYFPQCRLHRRKLKVLILLNVLAILAGALMPGDWIKDGVERGKTVWAKLAAPVPAVPLDTSPSDPATKKEPDDRQMDRFIGVINDTHRTGHFVLFASLCFLVYLSAALERQHPVYFVKVGFDVLLFAAVTEALQCLTLDRSAALRDILVDVFGMITALVLFLAMLPLVRRLRLKAG